MLTLLQGLSYALPLRGRLVSKRHAYTHTTACLARHSLTQRQLASATSINSSLPCKGEREGHVRTAHAAAANIAKSTFDSIKPGEGAWDKALNERLWDERVGKCCRSARSME